MIDLTPLDVRKKKGDFRRSVRGYDPELVDDFLDMVAERLEELVKQNVSLSERTEQLEEQVASYREREKALNEALVTAQQLRADAEDQAKREAEFVRRQAESEAEQIVEEGRRSLRDLQRDIETLVTRKRQYIRGFRSLLERHLSELEVEEGRLESDAEELADVTADVSGRGSPPETAEEGSVGAERDWLGSILEEGERKEEG